MPHGVGVFVGKLKTWDKGGFSKAQVWDSRQTETVSAGPRVFSCLHLHVCCVKGWGGASHLCPLQFSFLSLVTSASTPVPFQSVCCVLFREEPASSRWPSLLSVQKPSFQRAQSCLAADIYLPPVSPRHTSDHVVIPWLHPFQGFAWFITGKIQHPWLSRVSAGVDILASCHLFYFFWPCLSGCTSVSFLDSLPVCGCLL